MENSQDIKIAKIETDVSWIKLRLNHMGDKQDWIIRIFILGTLVSIAISLLK